MIANQATPVDIPPYTIIPCDPGTKAPPGWFISGRHYEEFEPGHDYTTPGQHTSHVTSQRCGLIVIDIDNVPGFADARLGALLAPLLEHIETYVSATDPGKTHIYVFPPAGVPWPVKWATHEWPYDLLTRGHVRAEPAYEATGNDPLRPDTETWERIMAAVKDDQDAHSRLYRASETGTPSGTPNGSRAGNWADDTYQITGDDQLTSDIASMVAYELDDESIHERLAVILLPLTEPWTYKQIQGRIDSARDKGYDTGGEYQAMLETMVGPKRLAAEYERQALFTELSRPLSTGTGSQPAAPENERFDITPEVLQAFTRRTTWRLNRICDRIQLAKDLGL